MYNWNAQMQGQGFPVQNTQIPMMGYPPPGQHMGLPPAGPGIQFHQPQWGQQQHFSQGMGMMPMLRGQQPHPPHWQAQPFVAQHHPPGGMFHQHRPGFQMGLIGAVNPTPPAHPPLEERPPLPSEPPPPLPNHPQEKPPLPEEQPKPPLPDQQFSQDGPRPPEDPQPPKPEPPPRPPSPDPALIAEIEKVKKEESVFMEQYKQWKKQYDDWREQNQSHPNKEQFEQYLSQWKTYEGQMESRRKSIVEQKASLEMKLEDFQNAHTACPQSLLRQEKSGLDVVSGTANPESKLSASQTADRNIKLPKAEDEACIQKQEDPSGGDDIGEEDMALDDEEESSGGGIIESSALPLPPKEDWSERPLQQTSHLNKWDDGSGSSFNDGTSRDLRFSDHQHGWEQQNSSRGGGMAGSRGFLAPGSRGRADWNRGRGGRGVVDQGPRFGYRGGAHSVMQGPQGQAWGMDGNGSFPEEERSWEGYDEAVGVTDSGFDDGYTDNQDREAEENEYGDTGYFEDSGCHGPLSYQRGGRGARGFPSNRGFGERGGFQRGRGGEIQARGRGVEFQRGRGGDRVGRGRGEDQFGRGMSDDHFGRGRGFDQFGRGRGEDHFGRGRGEDHFGRGRGELNRGRGIGMAATRGDFMRGRGIAPHRGRGGFFNSVPDSSDFEDSQDAALPARGRGGWQGRGRGRGAAPHYPLFEETSQENDFGNQETGDEDEIERQAEMQYSVDDVDQRLIEPEEGFHYGMRGRGRGNTLRGRGRGGPFGGPYGSREGDFPDTDTRFRAQGGFENQEDIYDDRGPQDCEGDFAWTRNSGRGALMSQGRGTMGRGRGGPPRGRGGFAKNFPSGVDYDNRFGYGDVEETNEDQEIINDYQRGRGRGLAVGLGRGRGAQSSNETFDSYGENSTAEESCWDQNNFSAPGRGRGSSIRGRGRGMSIEAGTSQNFDDDWKQDPYGQEEINRSESSQFEKEAPAKERFEDEPLVKRGRFDVDEIGRFGPPYDRLPPRDLYDPYGDRFYDPYGRDPDPFFRDPYGPYDPYGFDRYGHEPYGRFERPQPERKQFMPAERIDYGHGGVDQEKKKAAMQPKEVIDYGHGQSSEDSERQRGEFSGDRLQSGVRFEDAQQRTRGPTMSAREDLDMNRGSEASYRADDKDYDYRASPSMDNKGNINDEDDRFRDGRPGADFNRSMYGDRDIQGRNSQRHVEDEYSASQDSRRHGACYDTDRSRQREKSPYNMDRDSQYGRGREDPYGRMQDQLYGRSSRDQGDAYRRGADGASSRTRPDIYSGDRGVDAHRRDKDDSHNREYEKHRVEHHGKDFERNRDDLYGRGEHSRDRDRRRDDPHGKDYERKRDDPYGRGEHSRDREGPGRERDRDDAQRLRKTDVDERFSSSVDSRNDLYGKEDDYARNRNYDYGRGDSLRNRREEDNMGSVYSGLGNRGDRDRFGSKDPYSPYRDGRHNSLLDVPDMYGDRNASSPARNSPAGRIQQQPPPLPIAEVKKVEDLLCPPGRESRPPQIVVIIRGLPGSGKTYVSKLLREKELKFGGSAPRMLCLDDYFMTEVDKQDVDPDTGKKVKRKVLEYEYEQELEDAYRQSLLKSFKKTVDDGLFPFIILDATNEKVVHFSEFWSYAKSRGFQVYVGELSVDITTCINRNIHNWTEWDIEKIKNSWEPLPNHYIRLDLRWLLQDDSIPEVEMEDTEPTTDEADKEEKEQEEEEGGDEFGLGAIYKKSKWELDTSEKTLDKLDGIPISKKHIAEHQSMKDYLQLDEPDQLDDDYFSRESLPGKKRVRWADIEEQKTQERRRDLGFIVGQTQQDWERITDDDFASKALNKTKYFFKS